MVESKNQTHNEEKSAEDSDDTLVEMPLNCAPLSHQVAGHFYGQGRTKLGLLQTNDGIILKPVQSPPHGEREHDFYKRLFQRKDHELSGDEVELRKLLPTYRGFVLHNEITYIKLDDVAYGIKYPAVADFKIGCITHEPEATPEKVHRHRSRYPPAEKLGFQLLGMRVFDSEKNTFSHLDKIFGRSLTEQNLIHGLALYFQFHQTPQYRAIRETVRKFEEVKRWFEKQTTYHFYASSLIVIYEAYLEDMLNEMEKENSNTSNVVAPQDSNNNNESVINFGSCVKVFMADFAHVIPAKNKLDNNYLYGLEKLIEFLQRLLKPDYEFKDLRENRSTL